MGLGRVEVAAAHDDHRAALRRAAGRCDERGDGRREVVERVAKRTVLLPVEGHLERLGAGAAARRRRRGRDAPG